MLRSFYILPTCWVLVTRSYKGPKHWRWDQSRVQISVLSGHVMPIHCSLLHGLFRSVTLPSFYNMSGTHEPSQKAAYTKVCIHKSKHSAVSFGALSLSQTMQRIVDGFCTTDPWPSFSLPPLSAHEVYSTDPSTFFPSLTKNLIGKWAKFMRTVMRTCTQK